VIAASNIAWRAPEDREMYAFLAAAGCTGLEIAPTRLFPEAPYEQLAGAREFSKRLHEDFGLAVCSLQSIWYGVTDRIFDGEAARERLLAYTAKAMAFSAACGCPNLVFGSPKNRSLPEGQTLPPEGFRFFSELGRLAAEQGCVLALEANPEIYGTNFINTTEQAFAFVRELASPGWKVNLDIGTVIYECGAEGQRAPEPARLAQILALIRENADRIGHVHLSEPRLVPVQKRDLSLQILSARATSGYRGCLSVEMADTGRLSDVQTAVRLLRDMAEATRME
jgi:sugar phosphate isomerase/epimerase